MDSTVFVDFGYSSNTQLNLLRDVLAELSRSLILLSLSRAPLRPRSSIFRIGDMTSPPSPLLTNQNFSVVNIRRLLADAALPPATPEPLGFAEAAHAVTLMRESLGGSPRTCIITVRDIVSSGDLNQLLSSLSQQHACIELVRLCPPPLDPSELSSLPPSPPLPPDLENANAASLAICIRSFWALPGSPQLRSAVRSCFRFEDPLRGQLTVGESHLSVVVSRAALPQSSRHCQSDAIICSCHNIPVSNPVGAAIATAQICPATGQRATFIRGTSWGRHLGLPTPAPLPIPVQSTAEIDISLNARVPAHSLSPALIVGSAFVITGAESADQVSLAYMTRMAVDSDSLFVATVAPTASGLARAGRSLGLCELLDANHGSVALLPSVDGLSLVLVPLATAEDIYPPCAIPSGDGEVDPAFKRSLLSIPSGPYFPAPTGAVSALLGDVTPRLFHSGGTGGWRDVF